MRNKILMTLALLLTAVTGAWADGVKIKFAANGNEKVVTVESLPHTFWCNNDNASDELDLILQELYGWPNNSDKYYCNIFEPYPSASGNDKVTAGIDGDNHYVTIAEGFEGSATVTGQYSIVGGVATYELAISLAEPDGPEVTWDAATKTGTFTMPAYDVEIAPIYAPVAKWATDGDKVLAPTAVEGIFAGTTDAIVNAGTVVEGQGTAMYFATTDAEMTAEKAAAADGWLATLPTAAGYDDATTVYVWYYIKGADTPDGQEASAENTFNDLEICATPLKVEVLSNKFDIALKAANANTIESGKATVKVGDAAATVTDGKIEKVKMGSKVTVTAKDGYKFRKAEAKKGIAKLLTIGEVTLDITGCTTWQDVIFKNYTKIESSVGYVWTRGGSFILKNSSGNVSTDALVDPNATDYYWSSSN